MAIDVLRDRSLPLSAEDGVFLDGLEKTRPNARKKAERRQRKRPAQERREARREAARMPDVEVAHDELWVDDGLDLPF